MRARSSRKCRKATWWRPWLRRLAGSLHRQGERSRSPLSRACSHARPLGLGRRASPGSVRVRASAYAARSRTVTQASRSLLRRVRSILEARPGLVRSATGRGRLRSRPARGYVVDAGEDLVGDGDRLGGALGPAQYGQAAAAHLQPLRLTGRTVPKASAASSPASSALVLASVSAAETRIRALARSPVLAAARAWMRRPAAHRAR